MGVYRNHPNHRTADYGTCSEDQNEEAGYQRLCCEHQIPAYVIAQELTARHIRPSSPTNTGPI